MRQKPTLPPIDVLFAEHAPTIKKQVFTILKGYGMLVDMFDDFHTIAKITFCEVYRNFQGAAEEFGAYLSRSIKNACISEIRRATAEKRNCGERVWSLTPGRDKTDILIADTRDTFYIVDLLDSLSEDAARVVRALLDTSTKDLPGRRAIRTHLITRGGLPRRQADAVIAEIKEAIGV